MMRLAAALVVVFGFLAVANYIFWFVWIFVINAY